MTDLLETAPAPAAHRHAVQFYEDDAFLVAAVADQVREALAGRRASLVVATGPHLRVLEERLAAHGVEVVRAREAGRLALLDARDTLDRFMVGGFPDEARFRAVIGQALRCAEASGSRPPVSVFGEMVDLLWKDGNSEAAIRLEALWNELAATHPFTLLCGYAIGGFDRAEDAEAFLRVCAAHDHVVPTERYGALRGAERLRMVATLEQRARALEAELEYRRRLEARLRVALAQATAASQAKSEFLAVMSHELRTPLNAIGGYAELMEMGIRGPLTDGQREDLRRIQHSQRHLLGLVNEVLNYARLETGSVDYDLDDVPAGEAVGAASALVAPLARARALHLGIDECDPALRVRADAEKLRQVLVNLLSNAVKFTPAGGAITVGCAADAGFARFRVADTGIGIPAEKLESVFEPFVQVRSDLTREHQGTGLGLAISRSIAEAMGGTLTVSSRLGEGSVFTLSLPLTAQGQPHAPHAGEAPA